MVPSLHCRIGPVRRSPRRSPVGKLAPGAPGLAVVGRNGQQLLRLQDSLGDGIEQRTTSARCDRTRWRTAATAPATLRRVPPPRTTRERRRSVVVELRGQQLPGLTGVAASGRAGSCWWGHACPDHSESRTAACPIAADTSDVKQAILRSGGCCAASKISPRSSTTNILTVPTTLSNQPPKGILLQVTFKSLFDRSPNRVPGE